MILCGFKASRLGEFSYVSLLMKSFWIHPYLDLTGSMILQRLFLAVSWLWIVLFLILVFDFYWDCQWLGIDALCFIGRVSCEHNSSKHVETPSKVCVCLCAVSSIWRLRSQFRSICDCVGFIFDVVCGLPRLRLTTSQLVSCPGTAKPGRLYVGVDSTSTRQNCSSSSIVCQNDSKHQRSTHTGSSSRWARHYS